MIDKKDVCIIRAKLKDDYVWNAIKGYGFEIIIPYKDKNIFLRLMREIWYKLNFPRKDIWYNSKLKTIEEKTIIVYDPLITSELLNWLNTRYPDKRIVISYENRADSTINPSMVNNSIEKWSYDQEDCKRYGMRFVAPNYFDVYSLDARKYKKKWDVLYLGRDKGRMHQILEYERMLKVQKLKTYFHICADRSYLRFKSKNYKSVLNYKEYLEMLKKSKAILNITREGQTSITQRELEAVFFNVKCITTNKAVKKFELYDASRYFILDSDDINEIDKFMEKPFKIVNDSILETYKYEFVLEKLLESEK